MNNSINAALKRLQLGPHEIKSPEQVTLDKLSEIKIRVNEACKSTFKDKTPTRDEFATFVGQLYEHEFSRHFTREEQLWLLATLCMEAAYRALYD